MAKAKRATRRVNRRISRVGHRPFASKAQARLFFANPRLRRYAKAKAHATGMHSAITKAVGFSPAYRALPERRVGATTASRVRHMRSIRHAGHAGRKLKGRH